VRRGEDTGRRELRQSLGEERGEDATIEGLRKRELGLGLYIYFSVGFDRVQVLEPDIKN